VEIECARRTKVKIIKLRGKLNLGPSLDRPTKPSKIFDAGGDSRFLLDLQEVPMIDRAVSASLSLPHGCQQRGGSLKLLNPSNSHCKLSNSCGAESL